MINRINLILRTKNLSPSQFADEIGVQRSSISHILSGRNNPSLEFVTKVLSRFPELETDWLVFGKGAMYKDANKQQESNFEEIENSFKSYGTEQDLFSQSTDQTPIIRKTVQDDSLDEKNKIESIENDSFKKASENPILSSSKENSSNSNLRGEKPIEKFVILYTDKTFCEYYPEKQDK